MAAAGQISPLVRWARYSALGAGIFYGFIHNRKVHKLEEQHQAFEHRKAEVKAKKDKEYADLVAAAASAKGVVDDPNSPAFDLEKYLSYLEASSKK